MPAFSIAIRAFRRRWLAEAIESVLAQTQGDLELVIYDDAGDLEALATATGDPRVRYHRADDRRTASGQRFTGAVAQCRGEYIGILDDDDVYAPGFVAALVQALDSDPRCGVAFCRSIWDDDGALVEPVDPRPAGRQADYAASMLRHGWWTAFSQMLIRRTALEAVLRDEPLPPDVGPDTFINLRIALAGWTHILVDGRLSRRRWHAGQLTRSFPAAGDMSGRHLPPSVLRGSPPSRPPATGSSLAPISRAPWLPCVPATSGAAGPTSTRRRRSRRRRGAPNDGPRCSPSAAARPASWRRGGGSARRRAAGGRPCVPDRVGHR